MHRRYAVHAALIAVVGVGCHGTPGPAFVGAELLAPSTDAEITHEELLRADLARADTVARRSFADGLADVLTDDVVYLRGGLPLVRGKAAVREILRAEPTSASNTIRWQPVRVDASRDGKSGYSYGYTIFNAVPSGISARVDRYIAFWRKEAGAWRISAYAETYGAPPPALNGELDLGVAILADVEMSKRSGALDAIRLADMEFSKDARKFGVGDAFGRYAADDAQMFSSDGELNTGPQAIASSFGSPLDKSTLVWHPVEGEMAASGDLGYTVGNAVYTVPRNEGAPILRYTKYLTVWKRQRDGKWRYIVDGGSARPGR